jgi:hypothetical protein
MSQSSGSRRARKAVERPKKPYDKFPLTPHPNGSWVKKIRGRLHYFGKWARRVEGVLVRVDGVGQEASRQCGAPEGANTRDVGVNLGPIGVDAEPGRVLSNGAGWMIPLSAGDVTAAP